MGTSESKSTNEDDTIKDITISCDKHASKEATAFCLLHKKTICMSCIIQNLHCDDDCKLQEIEYVDRKVLLCLKMKEKLNEYEAKLDVNVIEDQMTTEIEAAYAEALDKLEEYKSASYEETKKEISNLIEREKGLFAQDIYPMIDEAIDHYMSGNIAECEKVFKDIEDTSIVTGITFEREIPSFVAEENSLVSVEEVNIPEQLDWKTCCRYWSDIEPVCDSEVSNDSDDVIDVAKCSQDSTRDKLSP